MTLEKITTKCNCSKILNELKDKFENNISSMDSPKRMKNVEYVCDYLISNNKVGKYLAEIKHTCSESDKNRLERIYHLCTNYQTDIKNKIPFTVIDNTYGYINNILKNDILSTLKCGVSMM